MTDYIKSTFAELWASAYGTAVHYLTLQFVDPFWWWCGALVLLYLAVTAFCWFFGQWWPFFRVIGGFMLLAATFWLWGYGKRKVEDDAKEDAKRKTRRRG